MFSIPCEGVGEGEELQGLYFSSDLASCSSKALIIEAVMKVATPLDLEGTFIAGVDALEGKEEGPVAIKETRAEADKALASILESLMSVTRSVVKARVAVTKVK